MNTQKSTLNVCLFTVGVYTLFRKVASCANYKCRPGRRRGR